MPTDLTTVRDHPANLLESASQTVIPDPDFQALALGAKHLREYEQGNGVTFAALDNDALASVREAYDAIDNGVSEPPYEQVRDLLHALDGLLGLS